MAGVEPALRSYQNRGLPLSDTGVVPTRGVAPPFLPCHGSGLLLTYAGEDWSGSGDLHAAPPAPQAGGTLSSLEPVEGAAGVAPALAGPRPAVQSCYTSPPRFWCTPLDSHQHSALIEHVSCSWTRGAWSGQRVPPPRSPRWQRGVLLARPWPRKLLVARAGVEPAARCSKDSSPYRYGVPGRIKLGAGEWNRTTRVLRLRIYNPLSPPPAQRRHGGDRPESHRHPPLARRVLSY